MKVEIYLCAARRKAEMNRRIPIDDNYGLACIDAMEAEIRAEYAARAQVVTPLYNLRNMYVYFDYI
jgi:hypothetical protein